MEPHIVVELILIIFAVSYVVLEVILNLNDLDNDTSNILILQWSRGKAFFLPFALGAVGGHLFLGTKLEFFYMNYIIPVVVLFGVCLLMLLIGHLVPFKKSNTFLISLLLLGFLYGHFIWSMNIKIS